MNDSLAIIGLKNIIDFRENQISIKLHTRWRLKGDEIVCLTKQDDYGITLHREKLKDYTWKLKKVVRNKNKNGAYEEIIFNDVVIGKVLSGLLTKRNDSNVCPKQFHLNFW